MMMKKIFPFKNSMLLSIGVLSLFACQPKRVTDLSADVVFPKPQQITATHSSFEIGANTAIAVLGESAEATKVAEQLATYLRPATGYQFAVKYVDAEPSKGNILLAIDPALDLGAEGYQLTIDEKSVVLKATAAEGLFYGVQTIRQLLPAAIEHSTVQAGPWYLATGTITDFPEYEYRGAMLDVVRHFFKPKDVKKYIDYIASYKLNRLHLHLTDDQGWRIEIKSWPRLTEVGARTQVGGGEGGFYTQEQYADIVKYAQDRYITVVPEIDMPGHTHSALVAYAELNPDNKAKEEYTGMEVGFSTFMTDKEITYKFITDVLTELAALTPGEYIHIGGDESLSTKKNDYIYFINRVQGITASLGKKAIGWDEVATATLQPGTIAQHWSSVENAQLTVEQNAKVLMSPASRIYLDMKYDSTQTLGLNWAGFVEVDKAYNWDPATHVEGVNRENIIGVEAPLWSETLETIKDIEYQAFPRILGFSEIAWTAPADKSFDDYKARLATFGKRLEIQGINFHQSPLVDWNSKTE